MDDIRLQLAINSKPETEVWCLKTERARDRRVGLRLQWLQCRKQCLDQWNDVQDLVADPDKWVLQLAALPDDAFMRCIALGVPVPFR